MERKLPSPLVIGLVIAGLLILTVAGWFFLRGGSDGAPEDTRLNPGPPVFDPPPENPSTAGDPIELPGLDASDDFVRSMVEELSEHPRLLGWVAGSDSLVRRLVAAVDNVAMGESPRSHLPFLAPADAFRASESEDGLAVDPRSYERYDVVRQVVISLDTAASVRLYHQVEPLLDRAYQELGYPDDSFRPTLVRALDHLLATPIPSGEVELERQLRSYGFADPELEALSEAQKHYLRMGAGNMRQLHAKLRLLQTTLERSLEAQSQDEAEPVPEATDSPTEGEDPGVEGEA